MASLADLPELVGFFSYSREDDKDSLGGLSGLRERIQRELRGQLGRQPQTFRLWQDKEAIPYGTLWEDRINAAVAESVFFIPIITPTAIRSRHCKFELDSFLAREATLGRTDLVFPIYCIEIDAFEDSVAQNNDPVLSEIAKRQYRDWRDLRHRDINEDVKKAVADFCKDIRKALNRSWVSPEEREKQEAEARERAEEERQRQEVEAKRREAEAEAEARRIAAAQAQERQRAEEERPRQEAVAKRRAEEERRRGSAAEAEHQLRERDAAAEREADELRRKEGEGDQRRQPEEKRRRVKPGPAWPPSRRALVSAGGFGVVVVGAVGACLAWFWYIGRTPAEAWAGVRDTSSIAILERFRTVYPGSIYAPFAEARIEELKKLQTVAVPMEMPPQPVPVEPVVVVSPDLPAATPPEPTPVAPVISSDVSAAALGECSGGAVTVSLVSRCSAPLSAAQERALKSTDTFKECDNCPELVVVPAGSFTMGSPAREAGRYYDEGPQHTVTIGKPFAVAKFHVTVDQFTAFVTETKYDAGSKCWTYEDGKSEERPGRSWRNPGFTQGGSYPAVCLNWNDAKAYVDWLARKTGFRGQPDRDRGKVIAVPGWTTRP
jgi:hypothetical protein